MQTSIKKIGITLIAIVLLPLIIYTIYELSRLSENEKVIEEIYTEQLNTIIFSVNQYTDDIVQDWARKIGKSYSKINRDIVQKELEDFCDSNSAISLIIMADTAISENMQFYSRQLEEASPKAINRMQKVLTKNITLIDELVSYKKKGYNKIKSLESGVDDTPLLSFLTYNNKLETKIATIVIDIDNFINDFVVSKISSMSNEELVISIFHNEDLISYTGGTEVLFDDLLEHKTLWNFPNYYLGISTPGKTIKDISGERTLINIIILGILNLVILLGVGFLFLNIRKEIKLSQLKSDFVSNVSHEIRTPLSLIGMFAETLELNRVNSEEEKNEYYIIIRKETERLTRIVNSILNFSKMESQTKKFNFERINLNDVLDEVLNTYKHELNNNKNSCLVTKHEPLNELSLDKEAIIEATMNLIDNALNYCEGKCEIEISTGIKDNIVFLDISDNGIGISKDNQKKIFEKFYRVSSGNVHNTKGSGLGLSLVKNIMEAHNGEVIVESKLGKGSKFRLIFPIS